MILENPTIKKIHNRLTGKPNPTRDINFLALYQLVGYASERTLNILKDSGLLAPIAGSRYERSHPTLSWEQDRKYVCKERGRKDSLNIDSYIKRLKARTEQEGLEKNIIVEENPGKVFFRESGQTYHPQYKITVKGLRVKCGHSKTFYFDSPPLPFRHFPKNSRREENWYNGSIYIEFKENIFQSVEKYDYISIFRFSLDYGTYVIFRGNVFEGVTLSLEQKKKDGAMRTLSFSRLENNTFESGFVQVRTGNIYDPHDLGDAWSTSYITYGFHTKFESLAEKRAVSAQQRYLDGEYMKEERLRHEQIQEQYGCRKGIAKIATSMCPWSEHSSVRITPDDIKPFEQNNNVAKILDNKFDGLGLFGSGAIVLAKNKINKFKLETSNIHFADVQKIEYMHNYKSALGDLKKRAIETEDRRERKILEKQTYKIEQKNMKADGYTSWWQRMRFRRSFYFARAEGGLTLTLAFIAAIAAVMSAVTAVYVVWGPW